MRFFSINLTGKVKEEMWHRLYTNAIDFPGKSHDVTYTLNLKKSYYGNRTLLERFLLWTNKTLSIKVNPIFRQSKIFAQ